MKTINFTFPLPRTHTGIALGNGLFGALIWGEDGINITVNRSDFWDRRGAYTPKPGTTTYEHVKKAYNPADLSWRTAVFCESPKPVHINAPSRLPFGRFELKLKKHAFPVLGKLEPETGTLCIWIGSQKARRTRPIFFDLSVTQCVLHIGDPHRLIAGIVTRSSWEWVGETLRTLAFPEPVFAAKTGETGWAQACPADAALAAICRKTARGHVIALDMADSADASLQAARKLAAAGAKSHAKAGKENARWWRAYWKRTPVVRLPDDFFNTFYQYALYKFGAATNPGSSWPAGLQGPWIEEYQLAPWHGDYHFNVNVQQLYSAAFASNHLEHLLPLFNRLESWREVLRRNAKVFCGIDDGLLIGMCTDDQGELLASGPGVLIDQACSGWTAQLFWQYYLYTGDIVFLRERALPFMHGVMRVYEEMLEETDGQFSLPLAISAEFGNDIAPRLLGKNPSSQLACIHMLINALLETSRILNIRPRAIWQRIKKGLPPYTIIGNPGEERIAIWEGQDLDFSHRHHSHLSCIYPFETLGKLTAGARRHIDNSIDHWISKGMGKWSEWSMPWAAIIQARWGFKESPWMILQLWRKLFINEGLSTVYIPRQRGITSHQCRLQAAPLETHEIMQLDGTMGAVTALYEMLVHTKEGVTHVFPAIPDEWEDISFSRIRLPGAFLLSAKRSRGLLSFIRISSAIGSRLVLHVGGHLSLLMSSNLEKSRTVSVPATLSLRAGEVVTLKPVETAKRSERKPAISKKPLGSHHSASIQQ